MSSMFTGLIEELGTVVDVIRSGSGRESSTLHLAVKAALVSSDAKVGDSIAVNGCCLTVVMKKADVLEFEAGSETLRRTNLDRLKQGSFANLERSLKTGDRLGGHFVAGHIDGTGILLKRRDEQDWAHVTIRAASRLLTQMASKGSVAVDGVSLTLVTVDSDRFSVALIPHTLKNTTLGNLEVGGEVNIETDLLAKYVERQLESSRPEPQSAADA